MTVETLRFKGDAATRRRFFTPESFQHPAKMASGLLLECIERYSQPGDLVLDPMAGSGTLLLGAMYGRHLILNEFELHFVLPMIESWRKIQQNGPALGCEMGQVVILRGDARCLPLPDASVGAAITSPPYEHQLHPNSDSLESIEAIPWSNPKKVGKSPHSQFRAITGYTRKPVDVIVTSPPYGDSQDEVGDPSKPKGTKRHYRPYQVDSIVTSPPYESRSFSGDTPESQARAEAHFGRKFGPGQNPAGYNRKPVDAIVTSPPYEGSITGDTSEATRKRIAEGKYHGLRPDVFTSPSNLAGSRYGDGYSRSGGGDPLATDVRVGGQAISRVPQSENIGNQRGQAYWDAMRQVYAECWRVLKPGGIMALALKGFTRDGKYVDLPGQTEALLLEAGWQKHDHWRRELWSLSFWRILQKRRDPVAWDDRLMYESVLAFRKAI